MLGNLINNILVNEPPIPVFDLHTKKPTLKRSALSYQAVSDFCFSSLENQLSRFVIEHLIGLISADFSK